MNKKTKRISLFTVIALFAASLFAGAIAYADDDVDISTAFPDPVFSAAIALHYDTNGDGKLSPDERSAEKMMVSGIVDELAESTGDDPDDLTISSLEGIEHFANLKTLYCNNVGMLDSLDVSALTELEVLNCSDNGLTDLDLSANTALKRLHCCSNEFTSLDFTANENLEFLHCYANLELTSLDVTGLTNLEELRCDGCQITELDLTTNTSLYSLNCSHNKLAQIDLSNTSANSLTDYHLGFQNITLEMIYADGKIQAPLALDSDSVYSTSLDDGETAYANGAFYTTDYSKIRDGFTYLYSTGKSGCAEMKVNVAVYHTHDYAVTAADYENKKLTINCQICGEDEHILDADLATVTVDPDCTTAGKTTNTLTAEYDSKPYTDVTEIDIPARGHDYKAVVTAPTCTAQGYTTYTCTRCTDSYVADYTDATGHTNGAPVQENKIDATCTAAGSYDEVIYCTVCTAELSREGKTINALGHNFGDWTQTTAAVAPTCSADGATAIETQYCSRCTATNTRGGETVGKLGHNYNAVVTAPTCTAQGYTTYTCTRCTDSYVADYTDATGHTNGAPVQENKIDATCTATGSYDEVVYCTVCTAELSREGKTINALGHNFGDWTQTTAAVAPTCTADGATAIETQYCSRCTATNTRGGETVGKLGHNYNAVVTAPTCTAQGYTTYTCTRCTNSYVSDYTDATGHTNGAPVQENKVDATCTAAGSYDEVVYCTVCTAELSREGKTINALGHNFGDWTQTTAAVAPTCTADGATAIETQYCSRCTATNTRGGANVPATGHTNGAPVQENKIDATCTAAGSYDEVIYCTVCTAELSREGKTINALGHNFGDWTETTAAVAPTCTADGATAIETQYCSRCTATNTRGGETVGKLGHNYNAVVTAPTCTAQGYTTYTCTRCTDSYVADYTDATGHTNGAPVQENKIDATCTAAGSYDEVIYCTVCTAELSREGKTINALGHNFGDWTQTTAAVAPTCTADGATAIETQYCSRCTATNTRGGENVGKLGHNYNTVVTAPTCTAQGYTTHTCTRCTDSYTDSYVDATGHTDGEPVKEHVVPATCTADGSYDEVVYCKVCHTELSRDEKTTYKLGHNYKTVVTAPTCTAQGYTTHTCTRCHDSYKTDPTAALGHSWNSGVVTEEPTTQTEGKTKYTCTRCGTERFESIPKLKVAEVTPTEKEADSAKVNKQIKKPTKIHTISNNKKKQLYIYFSPVKNAQNYRIMYRKHGDKKWKKSWTKGKTEFTIKNLKANGLYEFKFAAYKKNAKGKWERGDYSTTSYRYYYKTTITKTKVTKNTVDLSWKRNKSATYYTVEYATNRDMKGSKKVNVSPNSKTSYKIKGLKKGKKYFIRVRAVKKVGGKAYIGEFSTRKTVTIK
ncbi:MAG: fibronectin type III domain-containing protein [Eubacterium sp.]|nr:fibronectin type III domain-containing protein [Eubacterium sp.]